MPSPKPWKAQYSEHPDFGEEIVIVDAEGKMVVGTLYHDGLHLALSNEDRDDIVRAVNNHGPLVDALVEAEIALSAFRDDRTADRVFRLIRATLAKAKE